MRSLLIVATAFLALSAACAHAQHAKTTPAPLVTVSHVTSLRNGLCPAHRRRVVQAALQKLADAGFSALLPCHCAELAFKDVLAEDKLPSHRLDNAEIIELAHRIAVPSSKWWPIPSNLQTLLIRRQPGMGFTTIWLEGNQNSPRGELYVAKILEGDPFALDAGGCGN